MNTDDKVTMRYEGDQKAGTLECVFTYRGKEYRVPYFMISALRDLYALPDPVREQILFWAKMLHNPD